MNELFCMLLNCDTFNAFISDGSNKTDLAVKDTFSDRSEEYFNDVGFFAHITTFEALVIVAIVAKMWIFLKTYLIYALAVSRTKSSARYLHAEPEFEYFQKTMYDYGAG